MAKLSSHKILYDLTASLSRLFIKSVLILLLRIVKIKSYIFLYFVPSETNKRIPSGSNTLKTRKVYHPIRFVF